MGETAAGVTFRPFRPEDEEEVLRLLIAAFGRWPSREVAVSPAEHLRWKQSSSEEARQAHVVAEAGSRIVGFRLYRIYDVHTTSGPLRACRAYDAAVDADYRARGVMTGLRDLGIAQLRPWIDLQLGGYSRIEAMRRLHESEERFPFANTIELLERPGGASAGAPPAVTAVERFDEGVDALWEEARRQFVFATNRDRALLNWRYCDVRGGSYRVRTVEEGRAVVAYIACKREHGKGYIADLLARPGREDAIEALVAEAVAHYDGEGVSAVRCWLPMHHPYREVLARHGFSRRRREKTLCWGPLRTPKRELAFLSDDPHAAIHYTMGDGDLI
jgi:hypothetical protein